jgi:hypothetical protein
VTTGQMSVSCLQPSMTNLFDKSAGLGPIS